MWSVACYSLHRAHFVVVELVVVVVGCHGDDGRSGAVVAVSYRETSALRTTNTTLKQTNKKHQINKILSITKKKRITRIKHYNLSQ